MKVQSLFVGFVLAAVARADLPSFSVPARIPLPPVSLSDIVKSTGNAAGGGSAADSLLHRIGIRIAPPPPRIRAQMPILKPKADIDPKMVIKPDESIDYKLLIKRPNVGPSDRQPPRK